MSEQHTAYHIDLAKPTYIENWGQKLVHLSFATTEIPLTAGQMEELCKAAHCYQWGEGEAPDEGVLAGLATQIGDAIRQYPKGAFVRLGSRSPKDAWAGHEEGFRCLEGDKAIALLRQSERVLDDLEMALHANYRAHVVVREWRDIPPGHEYRAFVKGKKIVGLSQYDYFHHYPEEHREAAAVRWAVDQFAPRLMDALHLDDCIADLWVRRRGPARSRQWEVKLIEINPWGHWTDPCLFDWRTVDGWSQADPYEIRYPEGEL